MKIKPKLKKITTIKPKDELLKKNKDLIKYINNN